MQYEHAKQKLNAKESQIKIITLFSIFNFVLNSISNTVLSIIFRMMMTMMTMMTLKTLIPMATASLLLNDKEMDSLFQ